MTHALGSAHARQDEVVKSVEQRVHVGHTHDGLENTKTTAISQRPAFKTAFQHACPQKSIQWSVKFGCGQCESYVIPSRSSYQHQNRSRHHKHHVPHSSITRAGHGAAQPFISASPADGASDVSPAARLCVAERRNAMLRSLSPDARSDRICK